jgi:hypothetical protein
MAKNKKLFPNSYAEKEQSTNSTPGTTATVASATEILSSSQIKNLIAKTSKASAVRQACMSLSLAQRTASLSKSSNDIYTGLLPLDQIGQKRIVPATTGSMAIIAGGQELMPDPTRPSGFLSDFNNRLTEFSFNNLTFTPLSITLSVPNRTCGPSVSNLFNTYFFGGLVGKSWVAGSPGYRYGTSSIDRYNRANKGITQLASQIAPPWCCYAGRAFGNLTKAIILSGSRIKPTPEPFLLVGVETATDIQYGTDQLQRFNFNGEDTQVISATLTQPRWEASVLHPNKDMAFVLFGAGSTLQNGGYNTTTNYNQGTQFDLNLESSAPIGEFRSHGGIRHGAASASSKTAGYVFAGTDLAAVPIAYLNSIFEFIYATKSGGVIGTSTATFPAIFLPRAAPSADNAYIFRGDSVNNHYIFNFARRDLLPIASSLPLKSSAGSLQWFYAASDYSPGWN